VGEFWPAERVSFGTAGSLAGNVTSGQLRDLTAVTTAQPCSSGSSFFANYDRRHLPRQVQIIPCSGAPYSYVRNTRNVAGQVTTERTPPGLAIGKLSVRRSERTDWTCADHGGPTFTIALGEALVGVVLERAGSSAAEPPWQVRDVETAAGARGPDAVFARLTYPWTAAVRAARRTGRAAAGLTRAAVLDAIALGGAASSTRGFARLTRGGRQWTSAALHARRAVDGAALHTIRRRRVAGACPRNAHLRRRTRMGVVALEPAVD
jgi:hypothetical protein